jgi:low temperature requirement protein LtrA
VGRSFLRETRPRAHTAGLCFGFLLRSWYFDGAGGARVRELETAGQHTRFHLWNYAHLPLFIGIGVAGIGFQKLVNTDASARLSWQEMLMLVSAVSLLTLALTVVQLTGEERLVNQRWVALQTAGALFLPFLAVPVAELPLVAAAILLVLYTAAQGYLAQRISPTPATDEAVAEEHTAVAA